MSADPTNHTPTTLDLFAPLQTARRVHVYAGYSFGMEGAARELGLSEHLMGVVVTPRYARQFVAEVRGELSERVILDNGAFPAWRDGRELSLSAQLDGLREALEHLSPEWLVVPDVVADADASWRRTLAALVELRDVRAGMLLAMQDGMDVARVAEVARAHDAGVFIGGSDWRFKYGALRALMGLGVRWVHVGRASKRSHLQTCCDLHADSCDSTTYLRRQRYNVRRAPVWRDAFARYAVPRREEVCR